MYVVLHIFVCILSKTFVIGATLLLRLGCLFWLASLHLSVELLLTFLKFLHHLGDGSDKVAHGCNLGQRQVSVTMMDHVARMFSSQGTSSWS